MEHRDLYKNYSTLQEKQLARQLAHLAKIKLKRDQNFTDKRKIIENPPKQFTPPALKFNKHNANILMLSEWMYVKPMEIEDFHLIACPKGTRMSLVTSANPQIDKATLNYKNGMQCRTVKTNLPPNVILDCVFDKKSKTIFLLDIISYTHVDLTDCDTAFRFYWMSTKFSEDDWRCTDDCSMKLLPYSDCANNEEMIEYLTNAESTCEVSGLDGFLFYHKEVTYLHGPETTPLVLWTFPFMLNELFEEFRALSLFDGMRPKDYSNYLEFIEQFNLKYEKKKNKKGRKSVSSNPEEMDQSVDELQQTIELEMCGEDV